MDEVVQVTLLSSLNTVVLKKVSGNLFVSTPNSFIIDKDGLLLILKKLMEIGFISIEDLEEKNEN